MLVVRRVELKTFNTVCIGNKTRRGHFAPARITDVQSISGGEDIVEKDVAIENFAIRICYVTKQNGCDAVCHQTVMHLTAHQT